ncbi:hypothetical protein PIB30_100403, partial [Stylosanthes scabra]|nr:hypothetical protein [Stylosanthes scabra]
MTGKKMEQKEQLKEILPCYMLVVQLFKERLGAVLATSTHKRGLPRLCVGLYLGLELGWPWRLSLPSTHMLAVLRICVAL